MSGLVNQPATRSAALHADERQELQRLREEVATLRAESAPAPGRKHVRWASIGAAVVVVLGCLLAPVSLVAVWTNNQVSDTDRFVATVGPLISDPLVLRARQIGSVPQPAAAPAATFDIVVHFLRLALRSLFVVGLVVACTGFLTGSSVTAVQIRGAARRSIAWLRRGRIAEVLQNGRSALSVAPSMAAGTAPPNAMS